ncbi:site-specific DNA-methyltransferase, partial [Fusobacterium ulcerans]|uniref:site-specific DNA-methyltransferase n=1 Tax=Fusobacterium ulcerans TaxID=861 RepID=UPI002E75C193
MQKLEGTSMDIVKDNIEKLKEIFPEVCTEGKIDFEVLRQLLGEDIENDKEKFYFSWNGKTRAAQISKNQSTGTLRPIKENPKVWDNTENIYIEGENLEVLKLLQKSYYRKIKMIYIDPPYNTGKQFVYPDNYKNSLKDYLEMTGQIGKEGYKLSTNLETNGRFHSDWLSMMYSRLIIARKLLTDDGVILISIDDRELKNLLALVNDYFGEKNIDILIWQKTDPQVDRNTNSKQIARFLEFKEYIVVVYKNKSETVFNKIKRKPEWKNAQKNADNDPRGNWQSGIFSYEEGHENEDVNSESYFEITTPNGTKY